MDFAILKSFDVNSSAETNKWLYVKKNKVSEK
jgi:hypothetical protein